MHLLPVFNYSNTLQYTEGQLYEGNMEGIVKNLFLEIKYMDSLNSLLKLVFMARLSAI